ncbi:hypothetical protein CPC08DRAFT_642870 [Agrocybe pediades]|nr:hypothetical protein CPC08DRAFT_642870 [Agrocybe pediades]
MFDTEENVTFASPRLSSGLDPNKPVLVTSAKPIHCPANHVLIKVDRFGFSANNVTYQALGEHPHFRYFDFHPAPSSQDGSISSKTHGLVPVWGFGIIVKSTHPKIDEGERVYGYFAPTRYLLLPVSPADVNKTSFYVPRPHLPADRRPYNQILRCRADPHYISSPQAEDMTMLYRPLYWTAFWCEDWLHSTNYRGGATRILVSSASSKTAFCFAHRVRKRISAGEISSTTQIIGLTSKKNIQFTKNLNLYHHVLDYDSFTTSGLLGGGSSSSGNDSQSNNDRWLYIDVAGNPDLNHTIAAHFDDRLADTPTLVTTVSLGMTNLSPAASEASSIKWDEQSFKNGAESKRATERKVEQFFMPEWLEVRKHQLPISEIFSRQNQAWKELMTDGAQWVRLQRVYGPERVKNAYEALTREGLGPDCGLIWSLWDEDKVSNNIIQSRL